MSNRIRTLISWISGGIICIAAVSATLACTAFSMSDDDHLVTAKSYDWNIGHGLIVVNPRGLEKPFDIFGRGEKGSWISTYGSVTFNQYGRDLPQSGLNEAGLVIEVLWLNETEFPSDDARLDMGAAHWIQYQLDTAASVEDVISSFNGIQIRSNVAVHYFISDRSGEAATVEFVGGNRIIHTGDTMPVSAITNSTYVNSMKYLETCMGSGDSIIPPPRTGSLNRFVRVAKGLKDFDNGEESVDPVEYAFAILDDVKNPGHTQWQLVYDQDRMIIHYRTADNPAVRRIVMNDISFDCSMPARVLDIHTSPDENGTLPWTEYTRRLNRELIDKTYEGTTFLAATPDSIRDLIAGYPDRETCKPGE